MKAKKIRFSGTERNRAATNPHAAGQGTTPPQGKLPTVIAVGTAALILANDSRRKNTSRVTTFKFVHSILQNWMETLIWTLKEGRSQSRWYTWKITVKTNTSRGAVEVAGYNQDCQTASASQGTYDGSSFLTASPLPIPTFSKKPRIVKIRSAILNLAKIHENENYEDLGHFPK